MKTGIRLFVCIFFIFALLLPVFSVSTAGQDLRYDDNGVSVATISADDLFDLFFADETPLTDFERSYLRSEDSLSFSYSTAALPDSLVFWNYDGTKGELTVSASAFRYTARNGEEVVWVPQSIRFADGAEQLLSKIGNLYSCTRADLWNSGSVEFTVDYAWTVALSAETADAILTGAFPVAKEIRDRLDAYEIDHAEWVEQTVRYQAYCEVLETYEKAHARWEQKQQNYENYLAAKAAYDASVVEYQTLSAAWSAYNNYRRLLAEYTGAMEQYGSYAQVMQKIDSCLAIMETMFIATTDENFWCFFPSVMGETVDSVLDNSGALIDAGAPKASINLAKRATLLLRPILEKYDEARNAQYQTEFEKKQALYAVYCENYNTLRVQMGNLYDSIRAIYAYSPAQTAMKTKYPEKIPHFRQFLSQLYILQALLDDFETVNLNLPLPGGDGNLIVGDLVESALRPSDNNDADPVGTAFPTDWIEAPQAPAAVEKPTKELPPDPSLYGAPTPVEAPGAEPVAPEVVAAPGTEPDFEPLTPAEEALLAQYDAGLLPNRAAKGRGQTLSFSKSISKTATFENKRTVVFYKTDGSELEHRTVEYGQSVQTPPVLSDYQTEQYSYTFLGWIPTGSGATEPLLLDSIQTNLSLSPLFAREKRSYSVTWELWESSVTNSVEYGERPVAPDSPVRPDDAANFYRFAGWSQEILPVTGNVTYTALWQAYPLFCQITWDLGNGTTTTESFAYGTTPQYFGTPTKDPDERNVYTFAGWSPELVPATANTTYTALWSSSPRLYTVTWDVDGAQTSVSLPYGALPQFEGTPTKAQDAQYTYTFIGWSPEIVPVKSAAVYTALWQPVRRFYTVTWDVGDGKPLSELLAYGDMPQYSDTPIKAPDERNIYNFTGWSPKLVPVTGNTTYTALWEPSPRPYTVVWDLGGTNRITETYLYGETPQFEGTPTKEQDERNTYTFAGWLPEITSVTANATYTAIWNSSPRLYTVTWNVDGAQTSVSLPYGVLPQYEGTPTKEPDGQNVYTFAGWSPEIAEVTANVTYTAIWSSGARPYTVVWDLGETRFTETYPYGETPQFEGTPTKPQDERFTYTFAGWSPEITSVIANVTYTALWEPSPRLYTVTWDVDGAQTSVSLPYGALPQFDGTPSKPQNERYTYSFAGWSPEITSVTANATYTALWEPSPRLYTITWSVNGTTTSESIPYGSLPQFDRTPTKEQDEQFTYTFTGWSPEPTLVKEDAVYTAQFQPIRRFYTVTWDLWDGNSISELFPYGALPQFEGTPTRTQDEQNTYSFAGWSPEITEVTGDVTYTAVWSSGARPYTVVWALGTNRIIETYAFGELPQFEGTPTKLPDERYTYTFAGWSPEISFVTENATYTAKWNAAPRLYTVTWDLGDGVITAETYVYGELPHYDGIPAKPQDEQTSFVFAGWSPEVSVVTDDVTYAAVWKSDARLYTVTWDLGDGNFTTQIYAFGELPNYEGTPTKAPDAQRTYSFAGWSPEIVAVIEDATYTAVWETSTRLYTVIWDVDGMQTAVSLPFGALPEYEGTPTKDIDELYFYTFTGWSPELRAVTEDTVYIARWKAAPRFYLTTWDLGNGEPILSQTPNGELPIFDRTPTRENDELYCYTFAGWSPKLLPATANATYTAVWQKSPLVKDADGNTHNTQTTDESVIVEVERDELDLKNAIDFAAEDGKTISLERETATVTLDAAALKETLPEMARVQWTENIEDHSFRVDFADAEGTFLQTDLSYQVSLSYSENQILTVYDADGETLKKLTPQSVDTTARLATYSISVGKTVVCKLQYRLIYQCDEEYYSTLPDYAESGETILLDVVCDYGYEFTGATLVDEKGTESEVGASFTMPAESLTVKLHITPIVYHIVFVCNGTVLSERDYAFGETIELPEDPTLPDEGENRFVFRGWSPQVSETATGEAREQVYEASFSIISNRPPEIIDTGLWQFFVSPLFLGSVAVLIVFIVAVVLVVRWRIKVRRKKKKEQAEVSGDSEKSGQNDA
ncbi:MAG: hypothetical protein E7680_04985 [Ruminococcaceae bacterium]|nr:hypothetical protein [Oscillospiraceae bacterium]